MKIFPAPLSRLMLLLVLLLSGFPLLADDVLGRRIDVAFHQTPLTDALTTLSNRGNFIWSYNTRILDASQNVSLIANDWTLREILYEILGENYQFKANGNYVIIKRAAKKPEQLSGYLKDPANGQGIANATVYDRKTLRATTTDSSGYYQLKVGKKAEIVVSKLQYADTVLYVTPQTPRYRKIDLKVATTPAKRPYSLETEVERVASQLDQLFQDSWEKWHHANIRDSLERNFQVSFLPKLGTNHTLSSEVNNRWSVNILVGVSKGSRALEIGGIANIARQDIDGVQIAGILNDVQGRSDALQVAGIHNRARGGLSGIQIAGISNATPKADNAPLQVAGIVNVARQGRMQAQVGGIANVAENSELQVAGIINSADTIQGLQVAGIHNRARKVTGMQIGLINSAKELTGLQIGLINRSGRRVLPFFNW